MYKTPQVVSIYYYCFFGGIRVKFDYYRELTAQSERIRGMLTANEESRAELKCEADKWRQRMADRLSEDFLPPIDRRDLMSLVQNLGYISYEVWRLPSLKCFDFAEGLLLKQALESCLEAINLEIKGLKSKNVCISRLRKTAYKLLSVWHSSCVSGCDGMLCDGYEAAGDAILRLADSLETALAVN